MSSIIDRQRVIEAEQAIIGAIFLEQSVMNELYELLEPRDFSVESYSLIWEAMRYNYNKSIPIDYVTIVGQLHKYNRLEEVGGADHIAKLAQATPSTANAQYYAGIVRDAAIKRRGTIAGQSIFNLADQEFDSTEDYLNELERIAESVRPNSNGDMKHLSETKQEYFDYLDTKDDFVFTGFRAFDEWMGGIGRGWLYILAGRPSVGKTAKALQMAVGIAQQESGPVLIWSQEMKRNQLINRVLSTVAEVNSNRIRRKTLEPWEVARLRDAYDKLERLPLHIEDAKNVTIEEVRSTARQFKRKHGQIGAIMVDYLTIMKIIQRKGETRSQAVGYVTRTAKQTALELDCPFIMLAQLSRDGAGEPKLEHLRDSGEIEQDADVVEFLWHNPEDTVPHGQGKVIQSVIAKGRDVGINDFRYLFKGWWQKYEELA